MKKVTTVLIVLLMILSCAAQQQVQKPRVVNKRIIYRDLTKPVVIHKKVPEIQTPTIKESDIIEALAKNESGEASTNPEVKAGEAKSDAKSDAARPKFFVGFGDESTLGFDKEGMDQFISSTNKKAHIFLVGHSHGKSSVGNLQLASKRAQVVAKKLWEKGYENIHVMASWGYFPVEFAPGRGVQVYVIDENKDIGNVPIVFARDVEEKQKESPKDSLKIAAPSTQSSADDV